MKWRKFPNYLMKITLSYLQDREFRATTLAGHQSNPVTVNDGIPQDTILEPLLFILFIAGLPTHSNPTQSAFADESNILTTRFPSLAAKSN